jgi:hypothetical protein
MRREVKKEDDPCVRRRKILYIAYPIKMSGNEEVEGKMFVQ